MSCHVRDSVAHVADRGRVVSLSSAALRDALAATVTRVMRPIGDTAMQKSCHAPQHTRISRCLKSLTVPSVVLLASAVVHAQAVSPWERAATNLEVSFTGPLARSMALVAIVLGGLMFMYGEGGAKRQISGIVFGGGLALFAAQFLTWLF